MIDFEVAKTWHRFFARNLELVAEGVIKEYPAVSVVRDDRACDLGRWIHGPAHVLHDLPAYAGLVIAHTHFHRCAGDFLRSTPPGTEVPPDALENFRMASAAVTAAIDRLMQDYRLQAGQDGGQCYETVFADHDVDNEGWSDTLLIGIPPIDEQHRTIVRLLHRMNSMPEALLMSEPAVGVLTELGHVLRLHFASEEAILKRCGMPLEEVDDHLEQHAVMLADYAQINIDAMDGKVSCVKEITKPVMQWAVDHVILYDMNLRRYLA